MKTPARCPYCGTRPRLDAHHCWLCGGTLSQKLSRGPGQGVAAHRRAQTASRDLGIGAGLLWLVIVPAIIDLLRMPMTWAWKRWIWILLPVLLIVVSQTRVPEKQSRWEQWIFRGVRAAVVLVAVTSLLALACLVAFATLSVSTAFLGGKG